MLSEGKAAAAAAAALFLSPLLRSRAVKASWNEIPRGRLCHALCIRETLSLSLSLPLCFHIQARVGERWNAHRRGCARNSSARACDKAFLCLDEEVAHPAAAGFESLFYPPASMGILNFCLSRGRCWIMEAVACASVVGEIVIRRAVKLAFGA